MPKMKLLVCLLALLLASCATNGLGPNNGQLLVADTACKWVKPIYISKGDALTDGTARQILALNKAWQSACPKP